LKLIVTADDFGASAEINAAVLQAHREGILTSASLMAGGDAFDDAVDIARRTPTLAVGLHIVVVDGKPVLAPQELGRLVDGRGYFPDAPVRLGMRYFFDPGARVRIAAEVAAQFSRFAATGLKMAHVDGHQHMHVHPAIFPLTVSLALRYNAGGIRIPRDELCPALARDRRGAITKALRGGSLAIFSRRCRNSLRGRPFATTERAYGLYQTGRMSEPYVIHLLQNSNVDSAEIYFHPSTGPRQSELGPNPQELSTLLSPAVAEVIRERGIRLCTYPDLLRGGL
jgi:hopanoid biosynthesis associated protein HpnK